MDRGAYIAALVAEQGARHARGRRRDAVELPEKPALATVDYVNALVRDAARVSSVEFIIGRRALLAGGDSEANRKLYNDAVSRVRVSLEGSAASASLMREAAASIKVFEGEDPRELSDELNAIHKGLKMTTDATKRADLIRKKREYAGRRESAERGASESKVRPVTDLLLDARSQEVFENLREVVKRKKLSIHKISGDDGDGSGSGPGRGAVGEDAGIRGYHAHPDPVMWYD